MLQDQLAACLFQAWDRSSKWVPVYAV